MYDAGPLSLPRIVNTTAMTSCCEILDDPAGRRVVTVIAKMTWAILLDGAVSIAPEPRPVRLSQVWAGPLGASSLLYPLDVAAEKPGTDVLLVGTIHPPRGRTVTEMDVGLRVEASRGALGKLARVYGPRVWVERGFDVVPSSPGPLEPLPLDYQHTFGGADRSDAEGPLVDRRNPLGQGVARVRASLRGTATPAVEDPAYPLTSRAPAPAGFGPIPAHWEPRASFAGTYDEAWRRTRAPLAPLDRSPRFESVAPPGLWSPTPLLGDEPIDVLGMRPHGLLRIRLPRCAPAFAFTVRGAGTLVRPASLDTVLVDADHRVVELTFRAAIPAPRKLQWVEQVTVSDAIPLPQRLLHEHRGRWAKTREEEEA